MKACIFRFFLTLSLTAFTVLFSQILFANDVRHFFKYISSLPENQRQVKADSFMNSTTAFPVTEYETICIFIFKGTANSIRIAGDFTGWEPAWSMNNIPGTDLWYYFTHFETDARLDYKFVINDSKWVLDPKNPYTCSGGYGTNSELRMPGYISTTGSTYNSSTPHGRITDTVFYSNNLQDNHLVRIYIPPGYQVNRKYPLVLFHDGPEFISLANADNILDLMIANQEIEPLIGVFVAPVERTAEFAGMKKDAYTAFIVNELMPFICHHYAVSKEPSSKACIGISNGGNIALYIGMKHPETFGKIGVMSSNIETVISDRFKMIPALDLEIYIDIGTYDIPVLITLSRDFKQILQDKKYLFHYKEWHEGHSWCNWKGHLNNPLRQFFPRKKD